MKGMNTMEPSSSPNPGFSPERAYDTAIAAVHAAGGDVPEWVKGYALKVVRREMDADTAVKEAIDRLKAEAATDR